MSREADHILKPSGIALHWVLGEPIPVVDGLLVVVRLRGHCDMDRAANLQTGHPLGWSYQVDGAVLPFSDLACDSIRGSVQAAMMAGNHLRGNILLGRAMGRVLAHELYHIVADTTQHGRDGVAQEALSPRELTSGTLEFQSSDFAAIQSGLEKEH